MKGIQFWGHMKAVYDLMLFDEYKKMDHGACNFYSSFKSMIMKWNRLTLPSTCEIMHTYNIKY